MQFDANLGMIDDVPITRAGELSADAEGKGADGVWVSEVTHSPFTLMTRAAEHTEDAGLFTALAVAFPRSPMVTAYTAWDIQALSGGRFRLGLGTQVKGHMERRFSVDWQSPGPRIADYVRALRAIWDAWADGEAPDYDGEYYSIDLCPPDWRPDPIEHPDVPVFIGAINEYNLRTAGELCDGVHVHPLNSPAYIEETVVPNLEAGAERSGRDAADVTICAPVLTVTGETEAERDAEREEVRRQIAFYGSTRTYEVIFAAHGWGDVVDDLHALSVDGEWGEMPALITDEMLDAFAVDAPWDEIHERIEDRYEHVDRVALYRPYRAEAPWTHVFE